MCRRENRRWSSAHGPFLKRTTRGPRLFQFDGASKPARLSYQNQTETSQHLQPCGVRVEENPSVHPFASTFAVALVFPLVHLVPHGKRELSRLVSPWATSRQQPNLSSATKPGVHCAESEKKEIASHQTAELVATALNVAKAKSVAREFGSSKAQQFDC